MKYLTHFRFAFAAVAIVSLAVVFGLLPSSASAQTGHDGVNSAGTDFFLSQMPNIPFSESWQQFENGSPGGYFLIGAFQEGTNVTINYFDAGSGQELTSKTLVLHHGQCIEYPIEPNSMTPSRPGEQLEWKSAHITSNYPITVQFYREGTSSGNLYQGIPTAALGKNYVVAAWNDCPHDDAPSSRNPDSTSSEFEIIAPYNQTTVTIIPNSTTYNNVVGYNTGAGHTSTPHPITITMQRGEIYWVRSLPDDLQDDLSGSMISSNKPIAVLGGQERGMVNDPQGTGGFGDDEDERDGMVEEMPPLESWGTDYPSIPTMPASSASCNTSGDGDLYRFFTADPSGSGWSGYYPSLIGTDKYGPQPLSLYQAPAADWENVTNPVDLITDSLNRDASGKFKKMYVVQYHYFQWVPAQEVSYRSDNEMNVVPLDHYITSTVFMVPHNSNYKGYQFMNIITKKDSVSKISMTFNGSTGKLESFMPPIRTYPIPLHPELVGLTFKLPSGDYLISGNTPFACYSYGRTETDAKTISGYAAPTGQVYGTNAQPNPPKADITPSCGAWHVHLNEPNATGNDGLADVIFLNDPDGYFVKPARVSTNCRTNPKFLTALPFEVGDPTLDFDVLVQNPDSVADAYIYVVDRDGNDTVIHLHYVPTAFAMSQDSIGFPVIQVGNTQVSTFTFHIVSTGNYPSIKVPAAVLEGLDTAKDFTVTSNPTLPATLKAGDSIVFTVTFTTIDTNRHFDKLDLVTGCLDDTIPLTAHQVTPIILASDWDFGNVPVGDTVCKDITVQNIGDWRLILDSNFVLHLPSDYTFEGPIPDTIMPGGTTTEKTLHFCFHPSTTGASGGQVNWGTNLNGLFSHDKKDTTVLLGYGLSPGMAWDFHKQLFTVECQDYDTVRRYLENTSSDSTGADVSVKELKIIGPDANDFTILRNQTGQSQFQLVKGSSVWVDLQFKPNLANGYSDRLAQVVANGVATKDAAQTFTDTIQCTGIVRHAIVTVTPASYDFGAQAPGSQLTHTFTITNTGDTAFVYTGFNLTGSDFAILSEPAIGSSLEPGQTDTIVLQYTAKQNGGHSAVTINIGGDHSYCNTETILSTGLSEGVAVAETPVNYPVTYICHNDSLSITATNKGTGGSAAVLLDSVQIVDYLQGTPVANQFAFTLNNSQLIAPMMAVDSAQTVTFLIRFTPAYSEAVSAQAIFYWEDTSRGQTRFFQDTQTVSGIGYQTVDTISLSKPAAASNTYTAVTANQVSMPVRLVLPFDTIAQVYGMQFTLRYYRDAFVFLGANSVQPRNDLQVVSADTSDDATNTNYQLLTIHLKSNTNLPILDSGTVATVNLQYVIGKDSISPFDVKDVMFLDNAGASVCWVANGAVPTSFYGQNLCGDATLRMYLHGGMPAFSIQNIEPNPISHKASITYTVAQDGVPVTMQVFNALGEPVATLMQNEPQAKGSYRTTLDASMLPSGLYTVYVSTTGFGISKQIVVTK